MKHKPCHMPPKAVAPGGNSEELQACRPHPPCGPDKTWGPLQNNQTHPPSYFAVEEPGSGG